MKTLKFLFLLAVIPTLLSAEVRDYDLDGYWYDTNRGVELEIKTRRNSIKVRSLNRRNSSWRTYDYRGRGLYDDCNGRTIRVRDYDELIFRGRRGDRRRLVRQYRNRRSATYCPPSGTYDDYRRDNGRYGYGDYDYYGTPRSSRYTVTDYCGSWYAPDQGFSLRVERYGTGVRAYFDGAWTYYEPYEDYYVDRRGNRYFCDGRELIWQSRNGKRRLRFHRR